MAINVDNKVSRSDVERLRDKRNKPEYEEGFEPDVDDSEFGFGDLDSFGEGGFGGESDEFAFGGGDGDSFGGFGDEFGGGGFGSEPVQPKEDTIDKIFKILADCGKAFFRVFVQTFKSFRNRSANDIGVYAKNIIISAFALIAVSVVIGIVGGICRIEALGLTGIPMKLILSCVMLLGGGLMGITFPAYVIMSGSSEVPISGNNEPDFDNGFDGEEDDGLEFDHEEGDGLWRDADEFDSGNELDALLEDIDEPEDVDFDKILDEVPAKCPISNRKMLVEIMSKFMPKNTLDFSKKEEIYEDDELFSKIEINVLKAIASAAKIEFDEFDTDKYRLDRLYNTLFTYELWVTRYRKLKNVEEIEQEVVSYFREDSEDDSVTATVKIEGDFYKIEIFKGENYIVTLGDILTQKKTMEFFLDEKNKLPLCVGVLPSGKPVLRDAKLFDTMLIAGKPRSGKSWFTFNAMLELMMFNSPEDVQFLIIDPKGSDMMSTLGLMPHVCGVHKHDNILAILDDIVAKEGIRREKLLADHGCDDIWALRSNTNIKLPILYIFIDEYMTVVNSIGSKENKDKLTELINIIISQLPSKGIRLMVVPHRATGVVDKTQRTMIQFAAAVKAEDDVVTETLSIKKFGIPLVQPGDTAIKMAGDRSAMFIKGTAIGTSDDQNKEICVGIAKAFYKMGFDQPNMHTIGVGFNRNEEYVKERLTEDKDSNNIQIDF